MAFSPEQVADNWSDAAAGYDLFEGLSAEQRTAVGEAYSEIMRSTQGQGPYGLEAEAHIAVGVR